MRTRSTTSGTSSPPWSQRLRPATRTGASERLLGFGPVIAVYLGLLLVVAASVSLLAIYWDSLGAAGVLALAVVYLAGYLVAGEVLRRRDLDAARGRARGRGSRLGRPRHVRRSWSSRASGPRARATSARSRRADDDRGRRARSRRACCLPSAPTRCSSCRWPPQPASSPSTSPRLVVRHGHRRSQLSGRSAPSCSRSGWPGSRPGSGSTSRAGEHYATWAHLVRARC